MGNLVWDPIDRIILADGRFPLPFLNLCKLFQAIAALI